MVYVSALWVAFWYEDNPVPSIIYFPLYLVLVEGLKEDMDQQQFLFFVKCPLCGAAQELLFRRMAQG